MYLHHDRELNFSQKNSAGLKFTLPILNLLLCECEDKPKFWKLKYFIFDVNIFNRISWSFTFRWRMLQKVSIFDEGYQTKMSYFTTDHKCSYIATLTLKNVSKVFIWLRLTFGIDFMYAIFFRIRYQYLKTNAKTTQAYTTHLCHGK